jgi:predicted RNase H-like nuclease
MLPKIREVDAYRTPADQSRINEGHPEVSFALRRR